MKDERISDYGGVQPSTWAILLGCIQLVLAGITAVGLAFMLIGFFAAQRDPDIVDYVKQNMNSVEILQYQFIEQCLAAILAALFVLAVSHFVMAIVLIHGSYTANRRIISIFKVYTAIWLVVAAILTLTVICYEPSLNVNMYIVGFFTAFLIQGVCWISVTADKNLQTSVGVFSTFTNT